MTILLIATIISALYPITLLVLYYFDVRVLNIVKRVMFLLFLVFFFLFIYSALKQAYIDNLISSNFFNQSGLRGEILGGAITTFLVFLYFVLFSPIIEVSPKIMKYPSGHKYADKYFIKAYNAGLFPLHEVRAYLTKVERHKAEKGKFNVDLYRIDISFSYNEVMPSWTSRSARENGNMFANLYRVRDTENNKLYGNIEEVLNNSEDNSFYRFTISYRSSIGGLRRVTTENYTLGAVENGVFRTGATFKKR